MSNLISVSMNIGSGKNAINNLEKIKRCDLHNNRKYKNNRNEEIDLSLSKYNITIAGTKNITTDIKEFYKKEFAEATYNYNKKQPDERRKIVDYLEKMDKDSKSNIATEFIFQIGDKEDWENKNLEDKKKTVEIFKKAIPILEEKGIKTVNASLHIDETSPHLHLIAVPIIENQKRGLEKQVSQNKVITKEILKEIRSETEKVFIEEYNKVFNDNKTLKKGCEIEEHLQIEDYKNTKKVLEIAKKTADKQVLKEKIEQDYKKLADEVKEKEKENNFLTNQITKLDTENKEKLKRKNELENSINNIDRENQVYKETLERNKKELEISNVDITEEIKELESKNIEIKKIKEAKELEFEKEFLYKANKIKEIEDLKREIEQKEIELKEMEEKRKAEEKKKNDFIAEEQERKKRDEAIEKAIADDKEKLKIKQEEQAKIKKELENIENTKIKIENDIKAALIEKEKEENTLKTINKNIEKIKEDIEIAIKNKEKLEVEKEEVLYTEDEAFEDIIKLIENKNDDMTIMQVQNFIDDFTYNKNNKILNTIAEEVKRVLPNFVENVDGYRKIVSENFRENINDVFLKTGNTKSFNKNNNNDDIEY